MVVRNLNQQYPRQLRLSSKSSLGFTLVEMIIAIALSVVVAAMAYQSLDGASRNAERTREVLEEINQLDKTWQMIGRDMRNIVPISSGSASAGAPQQEPTLQSFFRAESSQSRGKDHRQVLFQFYRRGWINPLGRLRSDLQIVNYRLDDGKLIRDYLPERNVPLQDVEFERVSNHQPLLNGVIDVQFRFLSMSKMKSTGPSVLTGDDYSRDWEINWPPASDAGEMMPVAVEITIELEGGMRSVRLFEIPQM